MIIARKSKQGTRYAVTVYNAATGKKEWIGTFPTRAAARTAEAEALLRMKGSKRWKASEFADYWIATYERKVKPSTAHTARQALKRFKAVFKDLPLDAITNVAASEFAAKHNASVPPITTMFNAAIRMQAVEHNPFAGLHVRGSGRRRKKPLTVDQVDELVSLARAMFGENQASCVKFMAYSGLRPGEVFALDGEHIDFKHDLIIVERRLYRGEFDLPKNNTTGAVALTPPARQAVERIGVSPGKPVFRGVTGKNRLTQASFGYWFRQVTLKAGLDVSGHDLRHFCGYYLHNVLGLPDRVVAEQLRHRDGGKLVRELYGHGDVGALDEIRAAFTSNVVPFRKRRAAGDG